MTKAMKITLSVFFVLAAAAMTLFICWHIQGRTAMDDAAAQVRQREGMFFVDEGYSKEFVKYELYDDLFGENRDKTFSFLPSVTVEEEEAFQMAMDFFERYKLSEGYPIRQAYVFVSPDDEVKYYEVIIDIDKPLPQHIINNAVRRKNTYSLYVNDSGVFYVRFQ